MAWSSAEISSADLALMALDIPILGANALKTVSSIKWNTTGSLADADDAHVTYPSARAYDGMTHLPTQRTTGATTHYLSIDVGSGNEIAFDFAAIVGHSLYTDGATAVQIQIADSSTFGSNLQTVGDFGAPTSNARLVDMALYHTGSTARRYSSVRYVRLKITTSGSVTPEINELILGRRRQLKHPPRLPWNPDHFERNSDVIETESGVIYEHTRFKGRRRISATIDPYETAYRQDILDWFEQINYGSKPFIWIDAPTTTPTGLYVMKYTGNALDFPYVGPFERNFTLDGVEQGPENQFVSYY